MQNPHGEKNKTQAPRGTNDFIWTYFTGDLAALTSSVFIFRVCVGKGIYFPSVAAFRNLVSIASFFRDEGNC